MLINIEIFLFIMCIILMYTMWHVTKKGEKSKISIFVSKFSIIGSIFIPVGIYLTYRVFSLQLQSMKREATYKVIDRGWLNINKSFLEYYKECPTFINSLYYTWQKKVLGEEIKYNTKDKWYAVNYISISIFQGWEDFITSTDIDDTGDVVWANNFLQWANSPILYNNWHVLKTNFAETTQLFGDFLFFTARENKIMNSEDLYNESTKFVNSDMYKSIIHKRFKK